MVRLSNSEETMPKGDWQSTISNKTLSPALNNIVQSRKLTPQYLDTIADPYTDLVWGYDYLDSRSPHSYFDYQFTGQDVSIYMEGTRRSNLPQIGAMPIMEFGCGVQQQKQPIYGFWSWTYDAMMRGTRIVNGMFRLSTKYPDYIADLISDAANARLNGATSTPIRGLDIDEANIQSFWTRNFNDETAKSIGGRNVFSSHPPFNFIIQYGVQSPSIYNPSFQTSDLFDAFQEDDPLMTDINERLVGGTPISNMQYRIEDVELTGMQTEYTVDGQVCSEVYTFVARDMYSPTISS
jgi:hypothetical protein